MVHAKGLWKKSDFRLKLVARGPPLAHERPQLDLHVNKKKKNRYCSIIQYLYTVYLWVTSAIDVAHKKMTVAVLPPSEHYFLMF